MDIGIIGGGASGMMAAITASKDHSVTILEHNSKTGKKILVTGNGRCNYTNSDMDISHFHGGDISFISDIIKRFDYSKTIDFFKGIGIYPKNRNGYIYPYSDQASAVLDCLCMELKKCGVNVVTDCNVKKIIKKDNKLNAAADGDVRKILKQGDKFSVAADDNVKNILKHDDKFCIVTDSGDFIFDRLIIATGSYAAEKTGSDGSGFELIKPFDIEVNKPLPALCSLICNGGYYKSLAGVRCNAKVSIFVNGEFKKADIGELQLTDYGISGIPIFQISYIASKALNKKKKVTVEIDFMPELTDDELCKLIKQRINDDPGKTMEEMLVGLFNKKLCKLFVSFAAGDIGDVKKSGFRTGKSRGKSDINYSETDDSIYAGDAFHVDDAMIDRLTNIIKHFKTEVVKTNSFENAQVCTGGIKLSEVDLSLECKKVKGLYFAGEILDVNGDCGGYNLQWAWSSGYVAGCLGKSIE